MTFMKDLVKLTQRNDAVAEAIAYMAADRSVPVDIMITTGLTERELNESTEWFLHILEYYEDLNG